MRNKRQSAIPQRPGELRQSPQQVKLNAQRDEAVKNARTALKKQNFKRAFELLNPLAETLRKDAEIAFLIAAAYEGAHQPQKARQWAEKTLRIKAHPEPMLMMARFERRHGDTDKAIEWCDKALKLAPNHIAAFITKAGAMEEAGRYEEARAIIEPMRKRFSSGPDADDRIMPGLDFEWAKLLVQGKEYDEAIELIDRLCADEQTAPENKRSQLHLKAKAADRKKDFALAYEAGLDANAIGKVDYDPDLHVEQVDVLMENWSREAMKSFPLSRCDSEIPIFVAGMPRSGTSLIDQIIDAHPLAAGVGELAEIENFAKRLGAAYDPDKEPPECFGAYQSDAWTRAAERYVRHIKKVSPPGVVRIVNKSLGNNKLVGLIARLFPKTRIIHAVRDPRDVAISCFMGGFNNHLHAWTTQMDWVGHVWGLSWKMMQHWKKSLDVPILDVHYEALVADPENQFPRLIEFLGLPWDDKCMEFHKSRRTVRTLSYDQVNRPLYTSSSGRHNNYKDYIKDIDWPEYEVPMISRNAS